MTPYHMVTIFGFDANYSCPKNDKNWGLGHEGPKTQRPNSKSETKRIRKADLQEI